MSKPRKAWTRGQAERELRSALSDARRLVGELSALQVKHASSARPLEDRIIDAALMRILADGGRYDALKLSRAVLRELCRRLLDPSQDVASVHRWVRRRTRSQTTSRALYRFAHRLRDVAASQLEATLEATLEVKTNKPRR